MPSGLEMIEERSDHFGVEIVPVETARGFPGSLVDEHKEEPQRIPIRSNGLSAGMALFDEPVREKRLQRWCDQRHRKITPSDSSRRPAANANSSGAADKYQ